MWYIYKNNIDDPSNNLLQPYTTNDNQSLNGNKVDCIKRYCIIM